MMWKPFAGLRGPRAAAVVAVAALALVVLPARAGVGGSARTLCVGGPGCFPTIQLAVDAARDGDTVKIGPGTFAGGVVIAKSVAVVGAGAAKTTVKGGGPVVTIGDLDYVRPVTVTLRGLKITGGANRGDVNWTEANPNHLQAPWGPLGGGVLVDGADVTKAEPVATIADCVIAGNRVQPARRHGSGSHPFEAHASGGGIGNIGRLTLIRTTVRDNVAGGGATTEAKGGGIWNATSGGPGSLTIRDSRITGNTAIVTSKHSATAQGGGIEAQDGLKTFVVTGSVVSGNRAVLDTHEPSGPQYSASAGGIEIGGFGRATIASTRITGNLARSTDPRGNPNVGSSALLVSGPTEQLVIRDVTITGNRTEASILFEQAGPPNCCTGGIVEINSAGTVTRTTIARNTNVVHVMRGTAIVVGTVFSANADLQPLVLVDSVIERNTSRAANAAGAAWAFGGGLTNAGPTVLSKTRVSDNTTTAVGKSGWARGGGVWNGSWPGVTNHLTLTGGTVVTRNVLRGSPGVALEGGGLYAMLPVAIRRARIEGNNPNDCHGC